MNKLHDLSDHTSGKPLSGIRVVEMEAIGPLLHAGMVLADLGADVVRVLRSTPNGSSDGIEDANRAMLRGRSEVTADLRSVSGLRSVRKLIAGADVLLEGSRPGSMEKLGLGPSVCLADNPALVYGRITGWGQDGPLAQRAGHDINYLALAGALEPLGPASGPPLPPLNYVGNFGGGSMFLLVGVLAALQERSRTGRGQVVDAAMIDGISSMTSLVRSWQHTGRWSPNRGTNLLDGAAPFYRTYTCADGRFVAVGALEDNFYEKFVEGLGLSSDDLADRWDRTSWSELTEVFQSRISCHSRDEWVETFSTLDACVTPVLSLQEAEAHEHARERDAFVEVEGAVMPGPAPRMGPQLRAAPARTSSTIATALKRWNLE